MPVTKNSEYQMWTQASCIPSVINTYSSSLQREQDEVFVGNMETVVRKKVVVPPQSSLGAAQWHLDCASCVQDMKPYTIPHNSEAVPKAENSMLGAIDTF